MSSSPLKLWFMAFRPKTLMAGISPVLIGTAMAYGDGIHHFPTAYLCLVGALAIQIGTNIANDYFDFKKGADTEERIGPTRVTQAGLIAPEKVRLAFIVTFAIAALVMAMLCIRGGWPIAIIGVLSIISGILYTGGPRPLGYMGLGEVFVLIFFGPVAVGGTYYVQSYEINMAVILAGLAPGFLSVAILAVNNYRDMDSDGKSGKRTLAVRFGRSFAHYEFIFSIIVAALIPVLIYYLIQDHLEILMSTIILFFAIPVIQKVLTKKDGPTLNSALADTGKLLFLYSVIFSIGWIV